MTIKIKSWVGRNKGKAKGEGNRPEDVKIVIKLLNDQILHRKVPKRPKFLDSADVDINTLTKAIEWFQREILKLKKPDGLVEPNGITYDIMRQSYGISSIDASSLASIALLQKPVGAIKPNAWESALKSLRGQASCGKLYKPHVMTLIDFTIPCNEKRMWIVDLIEQKLLLDSPFLVAHGKGGGNNAPKSKNKKKSITKYFSNKIDSDLSSVGAFVTLHTRLDPMPDPKPKKEKNKKEKTKKQLGGFKDGKKRPVLVLEGLEKTNSNAKSRGILFHAAIYVDPIKKDVGMSHGCFATAESVNKKILPIIKNGSFVYAYGPNITKYP
jgi:hypothetical protein